MRLRYRVLNVFGRPGEPFSGNPLCVVEDGRALHEEQMQGVARQFNLSETTFLVDPVDGADAGVRIFTPNYEMVFAGHPTLGSAHVVRDLLGTPDAVRLSMPVGIVPVEADGDRWTLTAGPGDVVAEYDPADIAASVGLQAGDLVAPVHQVCTGNAQVIARAASPQAVEGAAGDAAAMRRFAGMGTRGGETLVYLWCETAPGEVVARSLFTQGSAAIEDPATGSACTNLGVWLHAQGRTGRWTVRQGELMGRPSTLELEVDPAGTVRVGGLVRELGSGTLEL